jgi:hypothetical protein
VCLLKMFLGLGCAHVVVHLCMLIDDLSWTAHSI